MGQERAGQPNEEVVHFPAATGTPLAEMAKGRLDSAGIRCFLAGENAGLLYGVGLDGVLLQVSAADEADARAILADPGTPESGEA